MFGGLLVESPSFWISNESFLYTDIAKYEGEWPQRVFMAMGTKEYSGTRVRIAKPEEEEELEEGEEGLEKEDEDESEAEVNTVEASKESEEEMVEEEEEDKTEEKMAIDAKKAEELAEEKAFKTYDEFFVRYLKTYVKIMHEQDVGDGRLGFILDEGECRCWREQTHTNACSTYLLSPFCRWYPQRKVVGETILLGAALALW